jgi:hypothetical protein
MAGPASIEARFARRPKLTVDDDHQIWRLSTVCIKARVCSDQDDYRTPGLPGHINRVAAEFDADIITKFPTAARHSFRIRDTAALHPGGSTRHLRQPFVLLDEATG